MLTITRMIWSICDLTSSGVHFRTRRLLSPSSLSLLIVEENNLLGTDENRSIISTQNKKILFAREKDANGQPMEQESSSGGHLWSNRRWSVVVVFVSHRCLCIMIIKSVEARSAIGQSEMSQWLQ